MSICAEVPWEEVAAELPSFVEEMEVGGNQVEKSSRRLKKPAIWSRGLQEVLIRNRMLEEEAMKELRKKNPPSRDFDDDETEDGVYDEEELDIREMRRYRRGWEHSKSLYYGSFEDNTTFRTMRYTEGTIPKDARTERVLEIFSVQVTETKDGLEWPLHVYGHIAVRDTVDQNRNLLFNRKRDNCQILTPKDSFLMLTGPSRPVMVIDPVTFEVDLKVKGKTEDEDKVLCVKLFVKRADDFTVLRRCFNKRSTVEITFAVLGRAVEATLHSVKVISGSWPDHLRGLVVSRATGFIEKDIVLLDSQDERMPITSGGEIKLSRSVVSVSLGEELTICVVASQVGDKSDVVKEAKADFTPLKAGWSRGTCDLGFCEVEIIVAWSLFTLMSDQNSHMRAVVLSRFGH